jgi:hypothetical protein
VSALAVEHEFELPRGYVDAEGNLHKRGVMRLATAADEIYPMKDPRVQNLPAYLIVILLSRVIVKLGTVAAIDPGVVEGLFAEDLTFLQELYNRINGVPRPAAAVACPSCGHRFEPEGPRLGGVLGRPLDRIYQEVAYLGSNVHWTLAELLTVDHAERERWVAEVMALEAKR